MKAGSKHPVDGSEIRRFAPFDMENTEKYGEYPIDGFQVPFLFLLTYDREAFIAMVVPLLALQKIPLGRERKKVERPHGRDCF